MQLRRTSVALLGFSSLVVSAPTSDLKPPAERGLRWKSRAQRRSPLAIIQEVQETNIIVVQENLDQLAAQQQVIEQEFAALVQAEVALVTQLETIKNNIRVNHFKARFSQVNTVIVTVQTLVDQRSKDASNRYLIKQLLADNGKPESEIVVMVSEAATMTIAAPSVPVVVDGASVLSSPTAAPLVSAFDPNAPFGQLNQSLILPAGAQAPKVDQIFADPASIILPNQNNLFVEDAGAFLTDCAQSSAFFQLQAAQQIFGSFEQLAAAQAGAVIINDVTIIVDDDNNNNNNNDNNNNKNNDNNKDNNKDGKNNNDNKDKGDGKNGDNAAQASALAAASAAAAAASEAAAASQAAIASDAVAAPSVTTAPEAIPAVTAPVEVAPAVTTAIVAPVAAPAPAAPQGFITIVPPPPAA